MVGPFRIILLLSVIAASSSLHYSSRQTVAVALPRRVGQTAVVDWCKDGVAGALQNTITRLFQEKLSVTATQHLRDAYIGNLSLIDDLTHALPDLAALFGHRLSGGVPNLLTGKAASTDPDMNNLIALTRLLPVFKDMLNLPDDGDVGLKLRTFTDNVCRFFDIEHESKTFRNRTPFSCAIIDAIQSGVACGAARFVVKESCEALPRLVPLKGFPNVSCSPNSQSLQMLQGNMAAQPFDWNDESLVLQIPLMNILERFHGVVPDYIPAEIRDAELLTYLILYRANQIIYAAQTHGWSPHCPNKNLFEDVQLIPGWKTLKVFAVAEPVEGPDKRATNLQTIQVPTVFISQDPLRPCHLAIGCRGTTSFHEWILDFNYWASADANSNVLHRGVQDFLSGLLPPLRYFLEEHSARHNCTCTDTEFTFYGHSLGGGLAQQLSIRVSKWFDFHRWDSLGRALPERMEVPKCELNIHNVLFAPLKQLDARTRYAYRRRINTRAILDLNDPLTYVPCHQGSGMYGYPRCGRGHLGYPGYGRDYFVEHPGVLFVSSRCVGTHIMLQLNVNYGNSTQPLLDLSNSDANEDERQEDNGDIDLGQEVNHLPRTMVSTVFNSILPAAMQARLPSPESLVAAHVCAHSCALSAACTSADFRWWCQQCPN